MDVASRDLRNDTAGILRRVAAGETVVITVRGRPVARLVPVTTQRPQSISASVLAARLAARGRTDPTFAADVARLAEGTTDDLGPLE